MSYQASQLQSITDNSWEEVNQAADPLLFSPPHFWPSTPPPMALAKDVEKLQCEMKRSKKIRHGTGISSTKTLKSNCRREKKTSHDSKAFFKYTMT